MEILCVGLSAGNHSNWYTPHCPSGVHLVMSKFWPLKNTVLERQRPTLPFLPGVLKGE